MYKRQEVVRGPEGRTYLPADHLYAVDLDLLGEGSLFQLLCLARTRHGERNLANWLLDTAGAGEIVERQGAVAELCDHLDLREDLALVGQRSDRAIDADGLVAWGQRRTARLPALAPISALGASALTLSALYLFGREAIGSLPLLVAIALQGAVWMGWRKRVYEALRGVDQAAADLGHLSGDPGLVEAFTTGQDIHAATASRVWDVPLEEVPVELRRRAKMINFGLLYGMEA